MVAFDVRYLCILHLAILILLFVIFCFVVDTVIILNFRTYRSGQTVQTQIRLLLEEQSDQGVHCLLFHLHLFVEIPKDLASFLEF